MSDPMVRPVDQLEDMDGLRVQIGVDYDAVTMRFAGMTARFQADAAEELLRALAAAHFQAGYNAAVMAASYDADHQETPDGP